MFKELVPRRWRSANVPVETEAKHPVAGLQRDINRMFEEFWSGWPGAPLLATNEAREFWPRVEISEDEQSIEVSAELPGMSQDDIKLTLSADSQQLLLQGEKTYEKETQERNYHRTERSYGSFQRALPLPCKVNSEKVKAKFKDGVLSVHLEKCPTVVSETRQITIKSS